MKRMQKINYKEQGITLIALVVTIIVLLILAGITLNTVLGQNGLIEKSRDSKIKSEEAQIREIIQMAVTSSEIDYYHNDTNRITAYLDALLNEVEGIDRNSLKDNGSNLITGTITAKSGKKYDFSIPVPLTDITVTEHEDRILEVTSVYAKLYDDGTLILSSTNYTDMTRNLTVDFGKVENKSASNYWSSNEYKELVTKVCFYDEIVPDTTEYYFCDLNNLTTFENMSNLETGLVTNMHSMFEGCTSLTTIDVSNFDTSNVTDMSYMFRGKRTTSGRFDIDHYIEGSLTTLDLSSFNTSNLTNMVGMFEFQVSLQSINLNSFDTSNVTNMDSLFYCCPSLTELDLSSFRTNNVQAMHDMFSCSITSIIQGASTYYYYNGVRDMPSSLERIYVSDLWDTSNVTDRAYLTPGKDMFKGCTSLVGAISYDSSKINLEYANYESGYLTYKSNTI